MRARQKEAAKAARAHEDAGLTEGASDIGQSEEAAVDADVSRQPEVRCSLSEDASSSSSTLDLVERFELDVRRLEEMSMEQQLGSEEAMRRLRDAQTELGRILQHAESPQPPQDFPHPPNHRILLDGRASGQWSADPNPPTDSGTSYVKDCEFWTERVNKLRQRLEGM
jgi:hypothetical protein